VATTRTAPPPRQVAPPPKPPHSNARWAIGVGVAAVIALIVGLAIGLPSSRSAAPPVTTTTTNPVQAAHSFQQQIATSLVLTKQIYTHFLQEKTACKSADCLANAAGAALESEGNAANVVHQTDYPQDAESAATTYVDVLISLQESYKAMYEASTFSAIDDYAAGLHGVLVSAEGDAQLAEAAL
jgi:hypothetical protein